MFMPQGFIFHKNNYREQFCGWGVVNTYNYQNQNCSPSTKLDTYTPCKNSSHHLTGTEICFTTQLQHDANTKQTGIEIVYPKSNSPHSTQHYICNVSILKETLVFLRNHLGLLLPLFSTFSRDLFCKEKIVHIVYHNISMYAQGEGEPVFVLCFFFFFFFWHEKLPKGDTIL